MATKKKAKKERTKSKRIASKKMAPKKKPAKKRVTPKKKAAAKRAAVKTKVGSNRTPTGGKAAGALKKQIPGKSQSVDTVSFAPEGLEARTGGQSGDLQGLSNAQSADSENVDELLEEGNAFEADAVKGVEDAGEADEAEVRTHEVPQDDVPGECRDIEE